MADLVTVAEAKAWLRVDIDDEDALIELLIGAASDAVLTAADAWDGTGEVPDRLKLACLARVAVSYDDRVNVSAGTGEDRLVQPFRELGI